MQKATQCGQDFNRLFALGTHSSEPLVSISRGSWNQCGYQLRGLQAVIPAVVDVRRHDPGCCQENGLHLRLRIGEQRGTRRDSIEAQAIAYLFLRLISCSPCLSGMRRRGRQSEQSAKRLENPHSQPRATFRRKILATNRNPSGRCGDLFSQSRLCLMFPRAGRM